MAAWPSDRARLSTGKAPKDPAGSMLRTQIPMKTWAQWDRPGFLEIDLVGLQMWLMSNTD